MEFQIARPCLTHIVYKLHSLWIAKLRRTSSYEGGGGGGGGETFRFSKMEMEQNIWNIQKGRQKQKPGPEPRNVKSVKPKAFSVANAPREIIPLFVYRTCAEKRPLIAEEILPVSAISNEWQ